MKDPLLGWKTLSDCLKSSGLMSVGLYSELARTHVKEIRDYIAKYKLLANSRDIKIARNKLFNSDEITNDVFLGSSDFYSLSGIRDYLFHVQEHRFTIPQIKEALESINLRFCGFESEYVLTKFITDNKGKTDIYDLDLWHNFEKRNPNTFAGMYQFWCQKCS